MRHEKTYTCKKSISPDLLSYILDAFKTHSHTPNLQGTIIGLPGEALITLTVPEPTPAPGLLG